MAGMGSTVRSVEFNPRPQAKNDDELIEIPEHAYEEFHKHIADMSRNELLHMVRYATQLSTWHEVVHGVRCSGTYTGSTKHCVMLTRKPGEVSKGWLGAAVVALDMHGCSEVRARVRTITFTDNDNNHVWSPGTPSFQNIADVEGEMVEAVCGHGLAVTDMTLDYCVPPAQPGLRFASLWNASTLYVELTHTSEVAPLAEKEETAQCTGCVTKLDADWASYNMARQSDTGETARPGAGMTGNQSLIKLTWTFGTTQADTRSMYVLYTYTSGFGVYGDGTITVLQVAASWPWRKHLAPDRVASEITKVFLCMDSWQVAQVETSLDCRVDGASEGTRRWACTFVTAWLRAGFRSLTLRRTDHKMRCTLAYVRDASRIV